jgi:hypothetical protein
MEAQSDYTSASDDVLPPDYAHSPFTAMPSLSLGADGSPECLHPGLNDDGSFRVNDDDGSVLGPYPVSLIGVNRVSMMDTFASKRKDGGTLYASELFITDTRILYRQVAPLRTGEIGAGQIRYSWIESVDFNGKQGWLRDCSLRVVMGGGPNRGDVLASWVNVHFDFAKDYDPSPLAQAIIQRAARHLLRQPDFPTKYADEMTALIDAPLLPLPAKNQSSEYSLPTFRLWPGSAKWCAEPEGQPS